VIQWLTSMLWASFSLWHCGLDSSGHLAIKNPASVVLCWECNCCIVTLERKASRLNTNWQLKVTTVKAVGYNKMHCWIKRAIIDSNFAAGAATWRTWRNITSLILAHWLHYVKTSTKLEALHCRQTRYVCPKIYTQRAFKLISDASHDGMSHGHR